MVETFAARASPSCSAVKSAGEALTFGLGLVEEASAVTVTVTVDAGTLSLVDPLLQPARQSMAAIALTGFTRPPLAATPPMIAGAATLSAPSWLRISKTPGVRLWNAWPTGRTHHGQGRLVVVVMVMPRPRHRRSRYCALTLLALPGMCTIHANSAREAVTKMCTLPLLAGENVGHAFVVPTVAGCIDLVVHIATERDGRRAVREVVAVPGRVEGDVVETADVFTTRGDALVRADGWPPHPERFQRAGFDLPRLLSPSEGSA